MDVTLVTVLCYPTSFIIVALAPALPLQNDELSPCSCFPFEYGADNSDSSQTIDHLLSRTCQRRAGSPLHFSLTTPPTILIADVPRHCAKDIKSESLLVAQEDLQRSCIFCGSQ